MRTLTQWYFPEVWAWLAKLWDQRGRHDIALKLKEKALFIKLGEL
jgi:hypothetical protein